MSQSLIELFHYFSQVTRFDLTSFNSLPSNLLFSLLFSLCAFFGYKSVRYLFSLIIFTLTILLITFILEGRTEWIYIATTFSVLSVVFAFMAYFSKRISVLVVVGLLVFGSLNAFNLHWIFVLFISIGLGLIAYFYPLITVILITSTLGSYELLQGMDYSNSNYIYMLIGLIIISLLFQFLSNQEGRVFLKKIKGKLYGSSLS